jgi:aryl-alcohol dehydrogenase-like predicted oxidoreductase
MEHLESYLAADGIDLSGDLLDRIDEIVPPPLPRRRRSLRRRCRC